MGDEILEILVAELDDGGPENALVAIVGKPKVKGSDDVGVDLKAALIVADRQSDQGGREPADLLLESPNVAAVAMEAEAFGEVGGHAVADVDGGRLRSEGALIEVHEDQPRLWSEGQTDVEPPSGLGILGPPCFDLKRDPSLLPLPTAEMIAGVAVRQTGLTENRVLVSDLVSARFENALAGIKDAALVRCFDTAGAGGA